MIPPLERTLRLTLPYQRGNDVRALQTRMIERTDQPDLARILRVPDGLFGPGTERAVIEFQTRNQGAGLAVDGVVGPMTWATLFAPVGAAPEVLKQAQAQADAATRPANLLDAALPDLRKPHQRFAGSVTWALTPAGLAIGGAAPEVAGRATVADALAAFGDVFRQVATEEGVPVELLIATACTESLGGARSTEAARAATRLEPGFVSVETTPHKVSVGLMQTLVSTAREVMKDRSISGERLQDPLLSVRAGAGYIRRQGGSTRFDPPCVACAYNAGGIYFQDGAGNRWKMRQYPIGTGSHADRFVRFFNATIAAFAQDVSKAGTAPSFFRLLNP